MMSDLPAPLVPPDIELRDFQFMPLDVVRLRDSRLASAVSGEEFRCAVLLWCAAWHQIPAASLPDDDVELSQLAGFGRAISEWKKVREGALYRWVKCSDGRLYHPVVAAKATEAWAEKQGYRWRRECDRIRKQNKVREQEGLDLLPLPQNPTENSSNGNSEVSNGIPAENALKGQGQGQGQGNKEKNAASGPAGAAFSVSDLMPKSVPKSTPKKIPSRQVSNSGNGAASADPKTGLFARAEEVLGPRKGGLVVKLLEVKGDDVALARAALETASTKANPIEYVGAMLRKSSGTIDSW
jgi:Protein of unknown function (DUF1376)